MEVVLLVVAVIGIAMVAVPRLMRRRKASVRAVAAATPAASWTPPADDDGWDDDLGWESSEPAPDARAKWEQFRTTALPEPAPEPVLPSVERWKAAAAAADDEWDDDLSWEGTPAAEPASTAAPAEPVTRTWSRGAQGEPTTAAAALTTAKPVVETGRADWLDEDWEQPDGRSWSTEAAPKPVAAPAAAPRRRKLHPVALVAIYAAGGIGVIVLASTALLGGASGPAPAPAKQVIATPTPTATPAAAPTTVAASNDGDAAAAAAEQKAHDAFTRERAKAMAEERKELAAARKAEAHRKAVAAAKKKAAARRKAAARATPVPTVAAPTQTYHPPASTGGGGSSSGGGGGSSSGGCEFCIG